MLEVLKKDIDEIKQDLTLIRHSLLGNDFNRVGLIKKVDTLEKEIFLLKNENVLERVKEMDNLKKKVEKFEHRIIGATLALSAFITLIVNAVLFYIKIKKEW